MSVPTQVRRLDAKDAEDIASLHYQAFKNFFLTSLGRRFLAVFYRALLSHPKGTGIGIYHGPILVGFAIGTQNSTGFYKSLIYSRGFAMAFAALPQLILAPFKIKRLLIPILASQDLQFTNLPSLLSICVSPDHISQGLGRQLLEEFEFELLKNHCHSLLLTTDCHDNDHVNQFYIRNKYICVQSFFHGKREMNLYYKRIKS